MYWSRKLLKDNAKQVLRDNYWRTLLMWLLVSLGVAAVAGTISYGVTLIPSIFYIMAVAASPDLFVLYTVLFYLFSIAVGLAVNAFLSSPVSVGANRYMMENRAGYPPLETVFSPFRGKAQYLNVVKVMFLYSLEILGFTLLFIIPGIVRMYQLFYVPWLLAENPYLDYRRAKELSKAMTQGEKMEIFVLQLSFIGWYLLGYLTCGIGFIFLMPYLYATFAELYAASRAKAFALGITGEQELSGFTVYPRR
ncbi:MAG TPA: DUF975 family protein [Candidatus Fournierella merdigallinarum]|nr:DUF975 family protein [Candidatus Fournierella merdigallinarum]